MKLIIRTYWNKVVREEGQPFGSRVLPEYELKDTCTYAESGWQSLQEWRRSVSSQRKFLGFDESGAAKIDGSKSYGIHQYQMVSLC